MSSFFYTSKSQVRFHRSAVPAPKKRPGKGAKRQANSIIRFLDRHGGEVGGLPSEVASYLAPLLDAGLIALNAVVTWCPPTLQIASSIGLQVKVWIQGKAFTAPSVRAAAAPADSEQAYEVKDAMVRLLHAMGHVEAPDGVAREEDMAPTEGEQTAEGTAEEAKEEFRVEGLLGHAEEGDKTLKEMDPAASLKSTLHPYQKQALGWMANREDPPTSGADDADSQKSMSLHPMWKTCTFPEDDAPFYCNVHSGALSMGFPHAADPVRGGILADEMGLGKTVEILSLIVTSPAPKIAPPSGKQKARQQRLVRSGATLVVCPMSMLGQWRSEAELHVKAPTHSLSRTSVCVPVCVWHPA